MESISMPGPSVAYTIVKCLDGWMGRRMGGQMDMVEGYGRQRKLGASQVLEVGQTQAEGREVRRGRLQAEPQWQEPARPWRSPASFRRATGEHLLYQYVYMLYVYFNGDLLLRAIATSFPFMVMTKFPS